MLRIELTGRLRVRGPHDEEMGAAALPGRQGRLILVRLATAGGPVPAEALAELVWPGCLPMAWRRDLAAVVSKVRAALGRLGVDGRAVLRHEAGCYELALDPPPRLDVAEAAEWLTSAEQALDDGDHPAACAAARAAARIARRPYLPGDIGDWVDRQRAGLEDVRLRALDVLSRAAEPAEAVESAQEAVAVRPLREAGHLYLIRAHLRNGSRSEALRAHARCRRLLREELGVEPMPAVVQAFQEALLAGDRGRTPTAPGTAQALVPLPAALLQTETGRFVGRHRELEELRRLSRAGGPARLVYLTGVPGAGKTALARAFAADAHHGGFVVLAGRCDPGPSRPFQPFVEALHHLLQSVPRRDAAALVAGWEHDLARLLPDVRTLTFPDADGHDQWDGPWTGVEPEAARYRLFDGVATVLARITARAPAILLIDDLHDADASTEDLLRHVITRGRARLLVVGTGRCGEIARAGGLPDRFSHVQRRDLLVVLPVGPLDVTDVAELLGPRGDLAAEVHRSTSGNAFFTAQLVRHLADTGATGVRRAGLPAGVADLMRARFGLLDDLTWRALQAAAVVGVEFSAGLIAAVIGAPQPRARLLLEHAVSSGLLEEAADGTGFAFVHDIVRDTLIDQLGGVRRAALHRAVGEQLESSTPWAADALAAHFRAAGPRSWEKAVRYSIRAAETASAALAHDEAARRYLDALRALPQLPLPPRGPLLLARAAEQVRAGDAAAADTFREAARLARQGDDPVLLARCAIGMTDRWAPTGSPAQDTVHLLGQALRDLPSEEDELRAALLARSASARRWEVDPGPRRELGRQAVAVARRVGDPALLADCLDAHLAACWVPGNVDRRRRAGAEVVRLARSAGRPELALRGHAWGIIAALEACDRAGLDAELAAYRDIAEFLRQPRHLWYIANREAMRALLIGDFGRGEALAQEARQLGHRANEADAENLYLAVMFPLWFARGAPADARATLGAAARRATAPAVRNTLACAAHLLESLAGQAPEAYLSSAARWLHAVDGPRTMHWLFDVVALAVAAARRRDLPTVARLRTLLMPYADSAVVWAGAAAFFGTVAHWLGVLDKTLGATDAAADQLTRALSLHTALGAVPWVERTRHERVFLAEGTEPDAARATGR